MPSLSPQLPNSWEEMIDAPRSFRFTVEGKDHRRRVSSLRRALMQSVYQWKGEGAVESLSDLTRYP